MTSLRLRLSVLPSTRSAIATAIVIALFCSIVAACGSSTPTTSPSVTAKSSAVATAASTSTKSTGTPVTTAPPTATASSGSSISETCPPASVVNAALGQNNSAPVSTTQTYGITLHLSGERRRSDKDPVPAGHSCYLHRGRELCRRLAGRADDRIRPG